MRTTLAWIFGPLGLALTLTACPAGDAGSADTTGAESSTGATTTASTTDSTTASTTASTTDSTTASTTDSTTASSTMTTSDTTDSSGGADSSSGGSGSDSGTTGTAMCEIAPDDDACAVCTKENCCAELTACEANEDCNCLVQCVNEMGLGMLAQCQMDCMIQGFPPGSLDLQMCNGANCMTECSG